MALLSHGQVVKNVNNTGGATTVTGTLTLAAGSSCVVCAAGFRTGTGTRSLAAANDKDGSLGAADSSLAAVQNPSYIWHLNNVVGGSTIFTITSTDTTGAGGMASLVIFVREFLGGVLTFAQQAKAAMAATTAWSSGAVTTGVDTELLVGLTFVTNRTDGVFSTVTDGNSNNYTQDQDQITADGERATSFDYMGTLATASRTCQGTDSTAGSGEMHFAAYSAVAAATGNSGASRRESRHGAERYGNPPGVFRAKLSPTHRYDSRSRLFVPTGLITLKKAA